MIKSYQLENIVKLANSDINPLILQGMLKLIADTDKWKSDFLMRSGMRAEAERIARSNPVMPFNASI